MAEREDVRDISATMPAGAAPPPGGRVVRHPSPKEYIRIAMILGVITAAEVAIYYMGVSRSLLIPALFTFSAVKFGLVVLWFMHLRFDSRTYSRFFLMGLAGAVTLFMIVLFTFKAFQA
jgi:cytochrome c oxidase subunit 4